MWKKYWPIIVAAALQVESLWKLLIWALDWRGRINSLVETYHDFGGVGAVIGIMGTSKNIPLWCDDRRSSSQRGRSFNPWPFIEAA